MPEQGEPGRTSAPRAVVIVVGRAAAGRALVDGAVLRVAHCRLDAVGLLADHAVRAHLVPSDASRRRRVRARADAGDRAARASVALVAADRAAVAEPEAGLAVLARDGPVLRRHRAPAGLGLDVRGLRRRRAVPRVQVAVHGVARPAGRSSSSSSAISVRARRTRRRRRAPTRIPERRGRAQTEARGGRARQCRSPGAEPATDSPRHMSPDRGAPIAPEPAVGAEREGAGLTAG